MYRRVILMMISVQQAHVYGDERCSETQQSNCDEHDVGGISGGPEDS